MSDPPNCPVCGKLMLRSSEQWWACGDLKCKSPLVPAHRPSDSLVSKEKSEFRRKMDEAGL